ncbi:hypothetical protein [uncultured Nonlabens sp.]|uniref:hypothetical protein n=1 Tax=uncultured Nonlabens sp. TaxID=859306 RepID=UPI00262C34CD|nr:hypothetical protein [uncultured Nonlabens sp.]
MTRFLKSHVLLIALMVAILCFILSYLSTDVVLNDQVYQEFLDEKYEAKYDEYQDLDIDLSEFEEELAAFEQDVEETSYGWDELYVDALFIFIPLLLVVVGYSCTYLVLILFHERLNIIKYASLLKVTLTSFLVFYIPELLATIYFVIFKSDYKMEDIRHFDNYFQMSSWFEKENVPAWLWNIVAETSWVYILFPLLVGLLLRLLYKQFTALQLIGYSYLAYLIVFIFYNTIFWYLFDLF